MHDGVRRGPLAEQVLLQGLGTVVVQLGHLVHADDRQDHLVPDTELERLRCNRRAGVLCAFPYVVDALPEQCLRRRPGTILLVAAVFRTKWLLPERCSATCLRRRPPGQMRRRQGRLQITAVRSGFAGVVGPCGCHADRALCAASLGASTYSRAPMPGAA